MKHYCHLKKLRKFLYSLSLLTLFLTSLIRPVFPVVDYMLNLDYIAEALCIKKEMPENSCNGKCYLMQQLEEKKETERTVPRIQWEIQLLSLHQAMSYDLFFEGISEKLLFCPSLLIFKTQSLSPDTPPPKQKSSFTMA